MPSYVKVEDGIVVQKQPYAAAGFIEAPDHVVCGYTYDGETFSAPEPPIPTLEDRQAAVDAEGDRRIASGFMFNGMHFQSRPDIDLPRIQGAFSAASVAVMNGAQADDLRWQDQDTDFAWIASDNSTIPMDAPTVLAFGQAAMKHVSDHVWAARNIKDDLADDVEIADVTDDALWP